MFDCFLVSLPLASSSVFLQSLMVFSSCIWWRGCEGCESLWCSWLWGNIRPPGQSRTCAVTWTRWFWSGRRQSSPRCSDGGLRSQTAKVRFRFTSSDDLCLASWPVFTKWLMFLTGSKRHIGKLLPCSGVVVEVSVRVELHPLRPGVVQTVVDSRGDADLVAHRDGVSCRSLREQEGVENSTKRRNFFFFADVTY